MKTLGYLLVILGILGLVIGIVGYDRQRTVLEVGSFKATATERTTPPVAPILGGIALASGIALLVVSRRRPA